MRLPVLLFGAYFRTLANGYRQTFAWDTRSRMGCSLTLPKRELL